MFTSFKQKTEVEAFYEKDSSLCFALAPGYRRGDHGDSPPGRRFSGYPQLRAAPAGSGATGDAHRVLRAFPHHEPGLPEAAPPLGGDFAYPVGGDLYLGLWLCVPSGEEASR